MKVVDAEKLMHIISVENFPKKGELRRVIMQLSFDVPLKEDSKGQLDMTNVFYPEPTMVWYMESYITKRRGIAFQDSLIDLSTGKTCKLQDILRRAQNMGIDLDDAIVEITWDIDFL